MMTYKKNLRWAIPILAACLLSACSSDENETTTIQSQKLTFGVTVEGANNPASRAAEWKYEDTYTKDKTLTVQWGTTGDPIQIYHYKATPTPQWAEKAYAGTLTVDSEKKKTVSVTFADGEWNSGDGVAALFPGKETYTFANGTIGGVEMPATFAQTGKSTTHLAPYMYMYGTLPCGTESSTHATMTLSHIPTVLRSLVVNKGSQARIVKSVQIVASTGFPSTMEVACRKQAAGNDFDITTEEAAGAAQLPSITVNCSSNSDAWNRLAPVGATDNGDRLMAYALCFPTGTEQTYTFKVTATDAAGNNETTYTSNVVASSRFPDRELKRGYYYTFELLLDDELSVSLVSVNPWGEGTIDGGEAEEALPTLYYTSTNGEIVTPFYPDHFGAKILSNTYADGQGTIVFDSHVTEIGGNAFSDCGSLASINIPEGVTTIGEYAFYNCQALKSITLPESITAIGQYAFYYCQALTSIILPDNMTAIGQSAFCYCPSLTSITVGKGNTVYDSRGNCNAIIETATNTLIAGCPNTVIPTTVKSIGEYAFHFCNSLASIDIPEGVESIGTNAFAGCSSLATAYCSSTVPPTLGNSVFIGTPRTLKIYVPSASVAAYQAAKSWTKWASYIADVATAPTEQPTIR